MSTINCMLWNIDTIVLDDKGACRATSSVSIIRKGEVISIKTPAEDTVKAEGIQMIVYSITAPGWTFAPWHGEETAPGGKPSDYPESPLLLAQNDQVQLVSWTDDTMVLLDVNNSEGSFPFYVSLYNNDGKGTGSDYWDPQIINDGSGSGSHSG